MTHRRARIGLLASVVLGALFALSGCAHPLLGSWHSAAVEYTDGETGDGLAVLTLFFSGTDDGGAATGSFLHSAAEGGCVTTKRFSGRWARDGNAPARAALLSVTTATIERNGCTMPEQNSTQRPLGDAERAAFESFLRGPVHSDGETLALGPVLLRRD